MKKFSDGRVGYYNYDTSLFFRNDRAFKGADPGVLWVDEKDDPVNGGWFYCVVTGGELNDGTRRTGAFTCYKSKDLNHWEIAGKERGYALCLEPSDWCQYHFWAPEFFHETVVVNGKKKNRYYLYFTAISKKGDGAKEYSTSDESEFPFNRFYIGIAVSDNPCGPFRLVNTKNYYNFYGKEQKVNLNGDKIDGAIPPVNFYKCVPEIRAEYKKRNIVADYWSVIDVTPFTDPATGDFYIYFSHHPTTHSKGIYIWVMKMKDYITPDYSTMRTLTLPGYSVETVDFKRFVNDGKTDLSTSYKGVKRFCYDGDECANGVNEGANVLAHLDEQTGKWLYYLTYSPLGYFSRAYSVLQAVSLSPNGPFKKVSPHDGQVVIGILNWDKNSLSIGSGDLDYSQKNDLSASIDFAAGCGHHTFAKTEKEIFAVYHSFVNPVDNNKSGNFMGRRISVDRVLWTYSPTLKYDFLVGEDSKYPLPLLYGKGPTYSLQPLPECASGYGDISGLAKLSFCGDCGNNKYLQGGQFVVHSAYKDREFYFKGKAEITAEFNPSYIRGIVLYNSCDFSYALKSIDKIEITDINGKVTTFTDICQNPENCCEEHGVMRFGGSIIADFKEIKAVKIKLYLSADKKFCAKNNIVKTGALLILARKGKKRAFTCGNSFGNGYVKGTFVNSKKGLKKTFTAGDGKIETCVIPLKGKRRVMVRVTDKIYHADEKGVSGKFCGLDRFYKNTSVTIECNCDFAQVSAYSVGAENLVANMSIKSGKNGIEKLVMETLVPTEGEIKLTYTQPTSETDLSPNKYEFNL